MILRTDDIWAELKRRRITATKVAKELGVAKSTVCRGINGDVRPSPQLLEYIASLLGVSVEELSPGRSSVSKLNPTNRISDRSTSKISKNRTVAPGEKGCRKSQSTSQAGAENSRRYNAETKTGMEAAA